MNIKDIKFFRKYYKEEVRGITNKNRNPNFVGTTIVIDGEQTYGFFELYHGDKVNIDNHITMYLDMAQDWQAVYEFLQNAYDSNSSTFGLFCDNDYLFVFNNGEQFSFEGIRSILNIGQSTKESKSNIGRFGVGFKIVHRLIGVTNGRNELKNYQGPILFSWNNYNDLKDLLTVNTLEDIIEKPPERTTSIINDTYSIDYDYPWLFKILLTNFPCSPKDKILDLNGSLRENIFNIEELLKLKSFTKNYLFDSNKFSEEQLNKGTIIFLKLGLNKSNELIKEHIKSGIRYSLSILNSSQKSIADSKKINTLYFNDIESPYLPADIYTLEILINRDDKDYQLLTSDLDITEKPETIEFVYGFPKDIIDDSIKNSPNFYLYFPLSEEFHNFNFILHCNIFHNLSQRTNLAKSERNNKIFEIFVNRFLIYLEELKKSDPSKYKCIYSSLLLTSKSDKQNKQWVNDLLYNKLLVYIRANIPSSENNYSSKEKVRIKDTILQVNPSTFGVKTYEWFWNDDSKLTSEARNSAKLDLKLSNLCNLIVDSQDVSLISNWLNNNRENYNQFIEELNDQKNFLPLNEPAQERYFSSGRVYYKTIQRDTDFRRKLNSLKFVLTNNNLLLSLTEIKNIDNFLFLSSNSIKIKEILIKLRFNVSEINVSDYPQIKKLLDKDFPYISDKTKLFDLIKTKTATENLKPEEKKLLFKSFSDIDSELLRKWIIFKNSNDEFRSIEDLLSPNIVYEKWFKGFIIKKDEYSDDLETLLIGEKSLFSKFILPNWELLIKTIDIAENIDEFSEFVLKFYDDDDNINSACIPNSDYSKLVLSKKYRLESEAPSEDVLAWIYKGNHDLNFKVLEKLGAKSENSHIVQLRKYLNGENDNFDTSKLNEIAQENKEFLNNTLSWMMINKIELNSNSPQYKFLINIYSLLQAKEVNLLPKVTWINQDLSFKSHLCEFNLSEINWYVDSGIIKELLQYGNDLLLNIYDYINKNKGYLYDFEILNFEFKTYYKANKISIIKELNYDELINNRTEYEADYYKIWKNEINNKFTIYKITNPQNALPYVIKFNNHELKVVYDQKTYIDVDGNIHFISENEELEEILINILNKNGFTKEYLDLLNEKKQNEPEEIAKQYDDIYSPPSDELIKITEDKVNIYFPPNEIKSFEEKLIELLNVESSPWGNGYIFHFSNLDNAANIINKSLISSRTYANTFNFNDSASSEQIKRTRDNIHNYARFYFRPHTPTQWHNEGLGRKRYTDNPKCPAPIFFKIKIEDVLKENPGKCFVSNGNLSSDWAKIGNSYEFLKKFDFLNLYSSFGNPKFRYASQQEFIIENFLSLNNIEYEIICKDEQDKYSLINLVGKDIRNNIHIDKSFYHYENPFVEVKNSSDGILIESTKIVRDQYDIIISTDDDIKFSKIKGIFTMFKRQRNSTIHSHLTSSFPKVEINLTEKPPFTIYYLDEIKKIKWLIFSDKKIEETLVNTEASENEKIIQQVISLDNEYIELYNSQVRHYKLKDHVMLVLSEFDKYFSDNNFTGIISKDKFKLFLAIHDIGKPIAESIGNRNDQYKYSLEIFHKIKHDLNLNDLENRVFLSLLSSDPIGKYFQKTLFLEEAKELIKVLANQNSINLDELFYLLTVYYQVDAGSYTEDAGGIKYLEHIFEYENGKKVFSSSKKRLKFSNEYEILYKKLKEAISI